MNDLFLCVSFLECALGLGGVGGNGGRGGEREKKGRVSSSFPLSSFFYIFFSLSTALSSSFLPFPGLSKKKKKQEEENRTSFATAIICLFVSMFFPFLFFFYPLSLLFFYSPPTSLSSFSSSLSRPPSLSFRHLRNQAHQQLQQRQRQQPHHRR